MTVFSTRKLIAIRVAGSLATLLLVASPSFATHQNGEPHSDEAAQGAHHHDHGGGAEKTGMQDTEMNEISKEYDAAMQKMHKEMSIKYTGDVDVDFVRGMVPHHQGAIDQAQILLKHSKDERLKYLAKGIIAAQTREIRFMTRWLKDHDQGVKSSEMPAWLQNTPSATEDAPAPAAKTP